MRAPVAPADWLLVRALRGDFTAKSDRDALFDRAEIHGLAGVMQSRVNSPSRAVGMRETARALDHAAHLALLRRIDAAFARMHLDVIALKGPLLGERLYSVPSARVCSDVDLLIAEKDIDAAVEVLRTLGYRHDAADPIERRFRAEHHHLHLPNSSLLPVELHFHAYRGFGQTLRSEPLLARKLAHADFQVLGVLSQPDELVYLAVHAAAHRFTRLAWLYELGLLAARMTPEELALAEDRARRAGFARVVAFAAELLMEVFGADDAKLDALRRVDLRLGAARALVREPRSALARSATRFAYSLALCDSSRAASAYAWRAAHGFVARARSGG